MKFKTQHGLIYLYYTFEALLMKLTKFMLTSNSKLSWRGVFPPCTNILFFLPGIAQGPPWDSSHMVT